MHYTGEKMKIFLRLSIISVLLCGILVLNGCLSPKEQCLSKAEEGDGNAQGILGGMYVTGNGSAINYKRAYYWLRNGIANGDSIAGYYMGVMYQYGFGPVVPDSRRAERHYHSVYKDIYTKAKKGDLRYINILAEMYYYGRGLKRDKAQALKMFDFCVKRHWLPAVENLGVIIFADEKTKPDLSKAKSLLVEAAMNGYPRAQFYLAEYYFNQGKNQLGMEQLTRSVENGFLPAMFRMAQEYRASDPAVADRLFKDAANDGYAPAMLVIAAGLTDVDAKLRWIKNAAEHSSVPAMLKYAKLISEGVNPNPSKEMILYQLALKIRKNDLRIKEMILGLDNRTGLYFPVKYTWENIAGGGNILLADSEIDRVLKGFKAGIVSGSQKLYKERLSYNPLPFFMNNDWFQFYDNGVPPLWSGLLFKTVEKYEADNPGFWIGYGISAGLAGQGTAQAFAAFKLDELVKKRPKAFKDNSLMNIAALLRANALILTNFDAEAYASLFNNGNLMQDELPYLLNFINFWCKPLLKDKKKFSIASGIDAKKLGKFALPEKKAFWDIEHGRLIPAKSRSKEPQIDFDYFKKKK